jgi:predicted nucleic acid-binding protein
MSYLLDTCILSKARKINSDSDKLKHWLDQHPETSYFISVLSIGEIQAGISKLKEEEREKKIVFENWLLRSLIPRFEHRILRIDIHTCSLWGRLRGEAQKKGSPLSSVDALIAASAIQHQLILVTDHVKDFAAIDVDLLNPLIQ